MGGGGGVVLTQGLSLSKLFGTIKHYRYNSLKIVNYPMGRVAYFFLFEGTSFHVSLNL